MIRAVLLVVLQFALLLALVAVGGDQLWNLRGQWLTLVKVVQYASLAFVVLALAHLGEALTPLPIPTKRGELRTNGMYAFMRHPTYSFIMLFGVFVVIERPTIARAGVLVTLQLFFSAKARWKESLLAQKFPMYREYAGRVGRFLPGVGLLKPETQGAVSD